jgi:hypothetical protein
MKNNENKKLCKLCAENNENCCCTVMPGSFAPNDIKLNVKFIANKLFLNEWAVDYWEDEPPLYYLRPATVGCKEYIDPSWGGICIYLTENGCKLNFEERPTQCKALIPGYDKESGCVLPKHCTKHYIALLWQPHEKLLMKAVNLATKK